MKSAKKIALALTMLALGATPIANAMLDSDCTPAPDNQQIYFFADDLQDYEQLATVYGIFTLEGAQALYRADASGTTTVTTHHTTTTTTHTTTWGNGIVIEWDGPLLGQCGYDGPRQPTMR